MKVRRYVAQSMKKALEQVKRDLGSDAVILHTKSFRKKGIFGLWGKQVVEITAGKDVNILSRSPKAKLEQIRNQDRAELLKRTYLKYAGRSENAKLSQQDLKILSKIEQSTRNYSVESLKAELSIIKDMIKKLLRQSRIPFLRDFPETLINAYNVLIQNEVNEKVASKIVRRINEDLTADDLKNADVIKKYLVNIVSSLIKVAGPIATDKTERKIVALIGPTGVGKTTTIAKLAANFKLRENKNVGLVTTDTYRIAAVEQLKKYAEIMDIPLHVALPDELCKTVDGLAGKDIVLIDTAGRSQRDSTKMKQLKEFIEDACPDEVHLVLSATSNIRNVLNVVEEFGFIRSDKVILTKLDENTCLGNLLNVILKCGKPISYITTGQDVPDDIEVCKSRRLARLVLGEDSIDDRPS